MHARAVKPDPKLNTEYTKKLNDAIKTATVFFNGAEHFLMTDRGLERVDAVLTYDEQSLAAGDRVKTIDAAWPRRRHARRCIRLASKPTRRRAARRFADQLRRDEVRFAVAAMGRHRYSRTQE